MRARSIKPGFFRNEDLAACGPSGMLLFAGLWILADRAGRLEDRPLRIRGELFAYAPRTNVVKLLDKLSAHGFIVRYAVNGTKYIQIVNFSRHQNPHIKETDSTIPAPCSALPFPERAPLTPDSLTPGSSKNEEPPKPPMADVQTDSCSPDGEREPDPEFSLVPTASLPLTNGALKAHQGKWFEEWWAIYWRKVSRKVAEKAFCKHVKSSERFAEVMAATKKQTPAMMAREPDFRPHGGSWLGAERWTDTPSPPQIRSPGRKGQIAGGSVMQRERKDPTEAELIAAHRQQARADGDPEAREFSMNWLKEHGAGL